MRDSTTTAGRRRSWLTAHPLRSLTGILLIAVAAVVISMGIGSSSDQRDDPKPSAAATVPASAAPTERTDTASPEASVPAGASITPRPLPGPTDPSLQGNCDRSYGGVCIPPPPPLLTCDDIPFTDFLVDGDDPHGLDPDGDGVGCESG
jgi:hypothetical protein